MKSIRLISLLGLISLTFYLAHHFRTLAQVTNNSGLTISPPSFEINLNPGGKTTNAIRIENRNDFDVRVAIDRRNFTAVGEGGAVGLTEEETSFSLASWININGEEATLPAKSSRTYTFEITAPVNAEPGGHFGSIVFRTIPQESIEGSGASVAQEIGALILVRVAGATAEDAKIDSFAPEQNFYEYGPVNLITRVENLGNVHLKPTGTISITNMFGRQVATVPLNSQNVLPGAIRRLDTSWDTKWGFGRYTATVVMIFGSERTQRAAITNFVVFPYRLAIAVGVGLLILGFFIYRSRRRLLRAAKILFTGKE